LLRTYGHTAKVVEMHQRANKEAKILTNAPRVTEILVMPEDWRFRWPRFYKDVVTFKRIFAANDHDDAPDMLTEIALELIPKRNVKGGRSL
jgi:predicted phage terminase large subunit-like protein